MNTMIWWPGDLSFWFPVPSLKHNDHHWVSLFTFHPQLWSSANTSASLPNFPEGQCVYKSSFPFLSLIEKERELCNVTGISRKHLFTECFASLENRLHKNTIHFLPGLCNTYNIFTYIIVFIYQKNDTI